MSNGYIVTGVSGKDEGILVWLPEATSPEDAYTRLAKLKKLQYLRVEYTCHYNKRTYSVDVLVPKGTDPQIVRDNYENMEGPRHYWELAAAELQPNKELEEATIW